MQKCAVLNAKMCSLQSTKANGIRTLFKDAEKIMQYYMVPWCMVYQEDQSARGGHIMSHIVVFDVEHPRRKSESTSYLTQLSKAKANTFRKKA